MKLKSIIVFLIVNIVAGLTIFLYFDIYRFYSFEFGFLIFIFLMIANIKATKRTIDQRIIDAKNEYENFIELNENQEKKKKIFSFLDISKLKLGLELTMSIEKFIVFIISSIIFSVMVYFDSFYPLFCIAGVFLSSVSFVYYLLSLN